MMSYEETMQWGARQYADVVEALRADGLPVDFVQTGGMCAALEAQLEAGYRLLITDAEDTLSWERESHAGWWVGLYPPEEVKCDGPLRFDQIDDGGIQALIALVAQVMSPSGTAARR